MIAIVSASSCGTKKSAFSFRPYRIYRDLIGEEPAIIVSMNKWYRPFLSKILKRLEKQYQNLLFSEEILPNRISLSDIFFQRTKEILKLTHKGTLRHIAVLCQSPDARLHDLLRVFSPYAHSVSLVSEDDAFCDSACEEALLELGLTLNRRTIPELGNPDLTFVLNGAYHAASLTKGSVINLSEQKVTATVPILKAVTNPMVDTLLKRHPNLAINPTLLVQKNAPITNLIWKN